jgi:hypothetical protein
MLKPNMLSRGGSNCGEAIFLIGGQHCREPICLKGNHTGKPICLLREWDTL